MSGAPFISPITSVIAAAWMNLKLFWTILDYFGLALAVFEFHHERWFSAFSLFFTMLQCTFLLCFKLMRWWCALNGMNSKTWTMKGKSNGRIDLYNNNLSSIYKS